VPIAEANKWETYFLKEALLAAKQSKDPSTKVGACIYNPARKSVISKGYNGFPRNTDDSPELYLDRATKYPRVVHAEANAIADAAFEGKRTAGGMLATTHHPCADCAGLIIQAGIVGIIYIYSVDDMLRHNSDHALQLFKETGIEITPLLLRDN